MFSHGSNSSIADNKCNSLKGKDIVEVEDKQEWNNGLAIANKGKEIMVEAEEKLDGNNGSPWELPPQEVLEAGEALAWLQLQGKDIMAEAEEEQDGNDGSPLLLQEEEAPEWLRVLLRAKFWRECRVHRHDKTLRRAEDSVFCVHCFKVICPHCKHTEDEPTHRLLKIRRYVFRSVVSTMDMSRLGVDVSYIQAYKCNGHQVVHLRPMKRSAGHRAPPETPRCVVCDCLLHTLPSRLCSLSCKHLIRTATDDLSGPRASHRLGRRGGQGEATSRRSDAQGEATSRPAGRRRRKQANPRRAPFF